MRRNKKRWADRQIGFWGPQIIAWVVIGLAFTLMAQCFGMV